MFVDKSETLVTEGLDETKVYICAFVRQKWLQLCETTLDGSDLIWGNRCRSSTRSDGWVERLCGRGSSGGLCETTLDNAEFF